MVAVLWRRGPQLDMDRRRGRPYDADPSVDSDHVAQRLGGKELCGLSIYRGDQSRM